MIEEWVLEWLAALAKDVPEIAILSYVALELRRNLLDCIAHNQELLDTLIKRVLNGQQ